MTNEKNGILIEAESFDDLGGWKLDTQFIHIMGSPYLLAHGLGKPVAPAHTTVTLQDSPANGTSATMSIGISGPMGGW